MSLWLHEKSLILASNSQTRRLLLNSAGLFPDIHPAKIDERALEQELVAKGANPAETARQLGIAKAIATSVEHPNQYVMGADQTLALGEQRFHKPENIEAARASLLQLSGKTHQLHSGVAITYEGKIIWSHVETADLSVRELSLEFIATYLTQAGSAILNSVGAYQYEGLGVHLFDKIEGDQSTILGMPLMPLLKQLRTLHLIIE